jgi:Alpha-L-rhamnosidase N-terminal domain
LPAVYTDGSVEWVATDGTWKASESLILAAEIYDGETCHARRAQPGASKKSCGTTGRSAPAFWNALPP